MPAGGLTSRRQVQPQTCLSQRLYPGEFYTRVHAVAALPTSVATGVSQQHVLLMGVTRYLHLPQTLWLEGAAGALL